MAKLIKGEQREQMVLFPITLEDMILPDSKVRVIDKYIDAIDMDRLGFKKSVPNQKGSNHYDDRDMLKLYVYGYMTKIRSSRKLADMCRLNIEAIWLVRGIAPDFRTICDFRKEHPEEIKNVFKDLVRFCNELDLLGNEQSQDGTKIQAVNSKERNYTLNKLDDRIKRIEESVSRYLKKLDKIDKKESEKDELEKELEEEREELKKIIEAKEESKKELEKIREELERGHESQKSLTDVESRLMKNNGGYQVCYNNQVVVDTKSHIVTNYKADNNPADIGTMTELMIELKNTLGEEKVVKDITDQGYKDTKDMAKCLENGIIPEVTLGKEQKNYTLIFDYEENEITEEIRKSENKEDIKKCLRSGVIPKVYEEFLSEVKVEEVVMYETIEEVESHAGEMNEEDKRNFAMENECFIRDNKKEKVICPMGEILRKKSKGKEGTKYCNKMACKNCKKPCTRGKYKELIMGERQVVSGGSRELKKKFNPQVKRRKKTKKVVRITLTPKEEDIKRRMSTSEHPHGTMKRTDGMNYFLLKGKKKVNGELGLYYIGSNLRRMIAIMGVEGLLEAIDRKNSREKELYSY